VLGWCPRPRPCECGAKLKSMVNIEDHRKSCESMRIYENKNKNMKSTNNFGTIEHHKRSQPMIEHSYKSLEIITSP
jgi:hypothetical protein